MPTHQEREQFLSDVSRAAGQPPTTIRWDENLETMAQQAAMGRYPPAEAPVWARDSELTAAHLERRRATMDEWDYRNIVSELGRLMAEDRRWRLAEPPKDPAGCDDIISDAASDQSSSRASDVSELSEVVETVEELRAGAKAAASAGSY